MRVIAFLAVLAAPAAAQDWDCAGDISMMPQQQINFCLGQRYLGWQDEMERAYAAVLARLPEEDEVRMRAAQLAWVTYRDLTCEVEAGEMRGGSGEAMLRNGCLARLTERRAQDLAAMAGG
ncbi:lysozyme inhibitor LprI family protein [Roseicyclus sediminis]|uniref:lysozyme inhibitor LprI family protein n=1 Tax=Roseicyclus sediminis TaxID=2980997 RepID=UPI0021D14B6C|nr:DUF1311 domain-containing protein [Roseibacterium sp. SDUM158016]